MARIADRILEMWRFILKWWLLNRLYKECIKSDGMGTFEEVMFRRTFLSKYKFAGQAAIRFEESLRKLLPWRSADSVNYHERLAEFLSIIDESVSGENPMILEHGKEGDDESVLIRLNPESLEANELIGIIPLFQHLLSRYWLVWTVIIIPFLGGLLTSTHAKEALDALIGLVF